MITAMRRSTLATVVVTAAVCGTGGWALSSATADKRPDPAAKLPPIDAVTSRMAVLDRLAPATEPLPRYAQEALSGLATFAGAGRGPDPDGAAAIANGRGRVAKVTHPVLGAVLLVAANKTLCMVRDGGATGCGPLITALPPASTTLIGEDRYEVSAMVPDGAREVSVETADGKQHELVVVDNIAATEVSGVPRRLTWQDGASGERSVALEG